MTERILGTPGKKRRRRVLFLGPVIVLIAFATMLIAASGAPAINTTEADYSLLEDQDGRNDEPGQKDLTLQGTDTGDLPTEINVLWNWDETSVGGGNSLDGCALFSTDFPDENIDFAFCAIVGNVSNTDKTLELKETVLYTCGDDRNDRCTQPIAIVPLADRSAGTTCQLVLNSNTNPFADDFPGDNPDTRIYCTVVLADVGGAASATLINTCSYPSQQPNSDPSDCVAVPGKANPTIATTPRLIPQDSATLTGQVGTGGSVTFELYKDSNLNGLCETSTTPSELVFSYMDTSSPYATVNSGDPAVNSGYSITTDGTYLWKVNYSGDGDNNPAESACGAEKYVIDVTP